MDHPGIRFTDPIGSLAYLQMSRGNHLLGDQINARGAYETFSKRWVDGDPDVPILKEAQREFHALPYSYLSDVLQLRAVESYGN